MLPPEGGAAPAVIPKEKETEAWRDAHIPPVIRSRTSGTTLKLEQLCKTHEAAGFSATPHLLPNPTLPARFDLSPRKLLEKAQVPDDR